MKKKILSMLLVVFLLLSMTTACNNSKPSSTDVDKKQKQDVTSKDKTTSFTDSAGREVALPADITRIVPSGALAQIVLFAIAPDALVGVSGEWNPSAEEYIDTEYYELPILGQFYGQGDLNLEEIAKVDPQVIIDIGESKPSVVEDMDDISEQVGIPTIHIEATTDTMGDAYRTLGKLLGKEKEGEALASYCEKVNEDTKALIEKIGEEGKVDLLYATGEDGLGVLAKDSFHAEIIDRVSNNVAVVEDISSKGTGNPVDMEQIINWNPEVIIFAPGSVYSSVGKDKSWQQLKAIKDGNYYEVPAGPYNWMGSPPSVNRYMGMLWITQLLYPEEAGYDMYDEAAKYYELFYHSELTEEQYNKLVANSLGKTAK
ncbi:ABC transporter substrate-binding protein [Alkalibaculum bacchi]|uniref:ABC transporter substrate-binding protein n=1 Tax=Alkalibaculum bacchi TaxID=645887 RepID=UPI0026F006BA|nr:ABC transporter substrate-binding protein [Alkalibaculum bacchi]